VPPALLSSALVPRGSLRTWLVDWVGSQDWAATEYQEVSTPALT
jgi:hypothetical protein